MLNVSVDHDGSLPVVHLAGRFDGHGATEFEEATRELHGADCAFWVLDLSAVEYLSSAGIRGLLSAEKALRARGGRLVLAGMGAMLAEVLDVCGLLQQFLCAGDTPQALAAARGAMQAGRPVQQTVGCVDFELVPLPPGNTTLNWWGSAGWAARNAAAAESLVPVRLDELGFALGVGGMGTNRAQAAEGLGEFVAAATMMGVLPADGHGEADFVVTSRPGETTAHLALAISFHGSPTARLRAAHTVGAFTLRELGNGLAQLLDAHANAPARATGFVLQCEARQLVQRSCSSHEDLAAGTGTCNAVPDTCSILLIGVVGNCPPVEGAKEDEALHAYLRHGTTELDMPGRRIHAHAFLAARPLLDVANDAPQFPKSAAPDDLRGVLHVEPETELLSAQGWLYTPTHVCSGEDGRICIEWPRQMAHPDEWDAIVRRIYHDASHVTLEPLHGGFSATTLHVTAHDTAGRQMLPTVLKLSSVEMGRREEAACREYVHKYILNNGTVILGTATQGNHMGVRYNFVGIDGPGSRLAWLCDHYLRRPSAELVPIFDRLFTVILKPWYGQPRWDRLRLFEEHTPSPSLFPNLLADAERGMGVPADEPTMRWPGIDRQLPNPYHALKHIYPQRRGEATDWYAGICHGDLNMRNILLDERESIYVIDFSETCVRNIVSDFARMETVVLFETLRLDSDDDLRAAAEFVSGLVGQDSLSDKPEFRYRGADPMVSKAYDIICRLRHYADVVTLFETGMMPYWLAMLQWTLPVASYINYNPWQKQLALFTSALLCEKALR